MGWAAWFLTDRVSTCLWPIRELVWATVKERWARPYWLFLSRRTRRPAALSSATLKKIRGHRAGNLVAAYAGWLVTLWSFEVTHYLTTGEFDVPCLNATCDVSYYIGQHLLVISLMLVVDWSPSVCVLLELTDSMWFLLRSRKLLDNKLSWFPWSWLVNNWNGFRSIVRDSMGGSLFIDADRIWFLVIGSTYALAKRNWRGVACQWVHGSWWGYALSTIRILVAVLRP